MPLIVLLIAIFITSCGTVNRKEVVLPIDSTPRGIEVYDTKLNLLGRTPFFLSTNDTRKATLNFMVDDKNKKVVGYKYRCPINWTGSIVPNALLSPFFPTGTVLSGLFYIVDYSTDTIYNCYEPINLDLKEQVSFLDKTKRQKKIIVLPAHHKDPHIINKLVEEWKKQYHLAGIKKEYELIPPTKTTEKFTFQGITNREKYTIESAPVAKIWRIAKQFDATHVMIFDVDDKGSTLEVKPRVYDLFNLQEEEELKNQMIVLADPYDKSRPLHRFFVDSVSLLPNAINWSPIFSRKIFYKGTSDLENEVVAQPHPDGLPKFVTAWGVEDVDNPLHFRTWDYSFKLYPSLHAQAWSFATGDYYIEMINWNFMYNGGITIHTPMGAIGISAGMGMVVMTGEDSLNKEYDQLDITNKFEISWYGFVRERWYLKISGSTFNINDGAVSNDRFTLTKWEEFYVGIGFYFPEGRDKLRELIPI